MNQITITPPEGYEVDKEKSTETSIVFKKINEKPTAKEWLLNFLSQDFTVKFTKGYITYYLGDQWVFQQDLKNERLWCYYYKVWQVFETEYSLSYEEIQALIKDAVGEALNCKQLTPRYL